MFEHASDSVQMIKHLQAVRVPLGESQPEVTPCFCVSIAQEKDEEKNYMTHLNRSYIDLALNANGKADLYFHAYLWTTYIESVAEKCGRQRDGVLADPEILRMTCLSTKPGEVIEHVKKYPFGKAEYDKLVAEFGGRKAVKKMKLIEQL